MDLCKSWYCLAIRSMFFLNTCHLVSSIVFPITSPLFSETHAFPRWTFPLASLSLLLNLPILQVILTKFFITLMLSFSSCSFFTPFFYQFHLDTLIKISHYFGILNWLIATIFVRNLLISVRITTLYYPSTALALYKFLQENKENNLILICFLSVKSSTAIYY